MAIRQRVWDATGTGKRQMARQQASSCLSESMRGTQSLSEVSCPTDRFHTLCRIAVFIKTSYSCYRRVAQAKQIYDLDIAPQGFGGARIVEQTDAAAAQVGRHALGIANTR